MGTVSRIGRLAVVALPACLLMACSDMAVMDLEKADIKGNDFNSDLARNYKAFAGFEAHQMYDWTDAGYFAKKGMRAHAAADVAPEDPADWNIDDPAKLAELNEARARLMKVLDTGGRAKAPSAAATAQQKFDCWVEEQEEGWQTDYINACKQDFLTAIAAAEGAMTAPAAGTPQPAPQTSVETQPRQYLVFFGWDRSDLNSDARNVLDTLVKGLSDRNYRGIRITGYADRSGPASYNLRLSQRRAETVAAYLAAHGVPQSRITTDARGESDPLVPTADGVREPQNRRAGILVQLTGGGSA